MDQMQIFYTLIRELVSEGKTDRLLFFKNQMESDILRFGKDKRLMEKYDLVCKAIEQLQKKKSA